MLLLLLYICLCFSCCVKIWFFFSFSSCLTIDNWQLTIDNWQLTSEKSYLSCCCFTTFLTFFEFSTVDMLFWQTEFVFVLIWTRLNMAVVFHCFGSFCYCLLYFVFWILVTGFQLCFSCYQHVLCCVIFVFILQLTL